MSDSDESDCRKDNNAASNKDEDTTCRMCKACFPDFNSLINHHCLPHECKKCLRKFDHKWRLQVHVCKTNNLSKSKASFECRYCNSTFVTSPLYKLHESSCSQNSDALPEETSVPEFHNNKSNDSSDVLTDLNSEVKLNISTMNGDEKTKNCLDSHSQDPSNLNNSKTQNPSMSEKAKLHFSGKFKNSYTVKNKRKARNVKETRSISMSSDTTTSESCMPISKELNSGEIIGKRNKLKGTLAILSDVQKLQDVNMLKGDVVENFAEQLKHLESPSNSAFNSIHSSQPSIKNKKTKKQASGKNSKKRKVNTVIADSQSSKKGGGGLSPSNSLNESSHVKKRTRKSRSSSREQDRDSGLELSETSPASNFVTSKIKNPSQSEKTFSADSEIGSLLKESNLVQQRHKKNYTKRKSDINNDSVLNKAPQHVPLELEVSESTLNDVLEENISIEINHSKQKEIYMKGKGSVVNTIKTENNIELGDVLNTLPPRSGILLKSHTGSFYNFKCPNCNKLFMHLKAGSTHITSCSITLEKTFLIKYNEIIYVCTACHYHSTRKYELINHKASCTPDAVADSLVNYKCTSKEFICSSCSLSCLSRQTLDNHPCTERLEYMKTCIVNVEKIDLDHCEKSKIDFISYEAADGTYLPQEASVKAQIFTEVGSSFSRKGKELFAKNAEKCNTVDDIIENVVKPVIQLNTALEARGSCPDLDLDMTLPYESQKLLAEAADKYITENKTSDSDKDMLKAATSLDDDNNSNDSRPNPEMDKVIKNMRAYKCKCKGPYYNTEMEKKPCVNCLNAFVKNIFLTESDSSVQKNQPCASSSTSSSLLISDSNGLGCSPSVNNPDDISCNTSASNNSAEISNSSDLSSANNLFEHIKNSSENISDGKSSSKSGETPDLPENASLQDDSSNDQTKADLPLQLDESGLPTSSAVLPVNVVYQNDDFIFTVSALKCVVDSREAKMTVTKLKNFKNDFKDVSFQNILIDLLVKLKLIILAPTSDSSSLDRILDIIFKKEFSVVVIEYNSVNLHFHNSYCENSLQYYTSYIVKATGQYYCFECDACFPSSVLIGHLIQEHKKTDIYINVIN